MAIVCPSEYMTDLGKLLEPELNQALEGMGCQGLKITGIVQDSRQVRQGSLYLALFGRHHDARDYVPEAIASGAAAVIVQGGGDWKSHYRDSSGVPVLVVDCLRAKIGLIASRYYDHPSAKMSVVGVTGTNGKTSCTQFVAQMLCGMGKSCGVIGTMGAGIYPELEDTGFTTPDAIALQASLSSLAEGGAGYVAMEVSSQGLHQYRTEGTEIDIAVFTNLTRDHIDYHGSMDAYAASKRRLFEQTGLRVGIVNADDAYAATMLDALPRSASSLTFSVTHRRADVYARSLSFTTSGYKASVVTPWGEVDLQGKLLGAFNFSNVLTSLTTVMSLDDQFDLSEVARQVEALSPVTGRMELVGTCDGVAAVVDYAHTPAGLECALQAVREHTNGQIWCVFGCGGDRDSGKRPMMAEIAQKYADKVVVTDDNPRMEDPDQIIAHIMRGFSSQESVLIQRDRSLAIDHAIQQAKPGDVVLIAGKGHEAYQDVAGKRSVFSDAAQARLAIRRREVANDL